MTLLLAGFDTTANSLTWAWILLMQHPDVYEEWQHSLGTSATLTKAVFDETLRLYPSAWILGRRALGDDHVGGVDIPAGAAVTISPFLLHRHPKFWDDAERSARTASSRVARVPLTVMPTSRSAPDTATASEPPTPTTRPR